MKPADDIEKIWRESTLSTNRDKHEVIFEKIQNAHEQSRTKGPVSYRLDIWRIIMKSPLIKLSAVAIIVIACLTGLYMFEKTSGIALADVLTKMEQIVAYQYRTKTTGGDTSFDKFPSETVVLVSNEYGVKIENHVNDPNTDRQSIEHVYLLTKQKEGIIVMPDKKQYQRIEFHQSWAEEIEKRTNDPRAVIKQMLLSPYKELGTSVVDGINVEGFRMTRSAFLRIEGSQATVTVWIDAETELPVRLETVYDNGLHEIQYDYKWNIPVDASQFEPVIPEDYTMPTTLNLRMPAIDEAGAIKGLQLFVDFTGKYPDNLSMEGFQSAMMEFAQAMKTGTTPAATKLREELKQAQSRQEGVQKGLETTAPLQGLMFFYMNKVNMQMDPAYHGKLVKPGDAELLLMRWRILEHEYRVIFGDLHVETVTAEALAELEAALPQSD